MKKFLFTLLFPLISLYAAAQPACPQSMEWFKDNKLGLFLHWGLYSQTAGDWKGQKAKGGEHFMMHQRVPLKEYAEITKDFNPVNYNAMQWADNTLKKACKVIPCLRITSYNEIALNKPL